MKTGEEIFGDLFTRSDFLQELNSFFSLPKVAQQKLFDAYVSSPYRLYYCKHSDELAAIVDIEDDAAHNLFHLFDYLAYNILSSNEPDEIIESLKPIFEDVDFEAIKDVFAKLKDQAIRDKLKLIDLIDDQIGIINPHITRLDYQIDQRIIFKKEKVVDKLGIVLLKLRARHKPEKELIFELTEHDIDPFVNKLQLIKKELEKVKAQSRE